MAAQLRNFALAAALFSVALFALLRPDVAVPFDILDFSEFLPLLHLSDSFVDGTTILSRYYAGHGRANVIPYALMSAKWELFGASTAGWQWARFVVVVAIHVLCFGLLTRLGTTFLGAVAGTSVLLVSPAAVHAWSRLTTAEPLGILFLLGLCHLLIPADTIWNQRGRWIVALLLVVAVVFTKEMLTAALLLPLFVLFFNRYPDAPHRRLPEGAWRFALFAGAVATACLIPVAIVKLSSSGEAFASQFGSTVRPTSDIIGIWLTTIIPFDPFSALPPVAQLASLALFLVFVVVCWAVMISRERQVRNLAWLVFGLTFPLVGALIYAPWPDRQPYYGAPFLIGPAVLMAFAFSALERFYTRTAWLAATCWCLIAVASWEDGLAQVRRSAAAQRTYRRLVERLHTLRGIDSVVVVSDRTYMQAWQGLGPTLFRYATAMGVPIPPTLDGPCRGMDTNARINRSIVRVRFATLCSANVDPTPIVERYRRLDAHRLRMVEDSVRVDIEFTAQTKP